MKAKIIKNKEDKRWNKFIGKEFPLINKNNGRYDLDMGTIGIVSWAEDEVEIINEE